MGGCSGPRIQLARVVYGPGRVPTATGCSPDPSVMDCEVTRPCSGDPAGGARETDTRVQPAGAQQESRLPEPGQQCLDLGPPDG